MIISGTIAARGLKFWLQVDLGPPIAPWGRRPDPAHPDPGNPVFPEIFFSLFLASTASWDLRVTPRMHRNHLIRIRIRIREIRFFRKSALCLFKLKHLQYRCLWLPFDLRVDAWWTLTVSGPPSGPRRSQGASSFYPQTPTIWLSLASFRSQPCWAKIVLLAVGLHFSVNKARAKEIRFFENPDFSIFRLFKLKDPTTWVSIDSPGST